MSNSKVIADFGKLKALTDDLQANRNARVKVGVLGGENERDPEVARATAMRSTRPFGQADLDKTNAEIGLEHEFGVASKNLPPRSFLRVPLEVELPKKLRNIGKAVWRALIEQRGLVFALENLGVAGVQTVEQGFRTGGFGRWPKLSALTVYLKGSSAILIDSGQLRRSIAHEVVGGQKP